MNCYAFTQLPEGRLSQNTAKLLENKLVVQSPFRDEFIAASLKRCKNRFRLHCRCSFRDEFIAASLKHP